MWTSPPPPNSSPITLPNWPGPSSPPPSGGVGGARSVLSHTDVYLSLCSLCALCASVSSVLKGVPDMRRSYLTQRTQRSQRHREHRGHWESRRDKHMNFEGATPALGAAVAPYV